MENKGERWRELCAHAAVEKDTEKLMKLVEEISRLLAEKQKQEDGNYNPRHQPTLKIVT